MTLRCAEVALLSCSFFPSLISPWLCFLPRRVFVGFSSLSHFFSVAAMADVEMEQPKVEPKEEVVEQNGNTSKTETKATASVSLIPC